MLEIAKPVLFGSSFGAMVALVVAGMFPELPSGLVISNSGAGRIDHEATREAFRRLGGDDVAEVAWVFLEHPGPETSKAYNEVCLPFSSHREGAAEFASSLFAKSIRTPEVRTHFQSTIKSLQPGLNLGIQKLQGREVFTGQRPSTSLPERRLANPIGL